MFPPLPEQRFSILYADPPWDYKGQKQHAGPNSSDTGGAASHYQTVKLDDLKELDIASICEDDCLLFMWVTNPHLDQGIALMKTWGFSYATVAFVWNKERVNPGFYTMSQCELCLVGKRGRIPRPRGRRNIRQYLWERRGPHSMKPRLVARRIEKMFPTQTKIELFARGAADPGWAVWGNEAETETP